ncbi:MFS transporter [Flavihumibacter solisilvae]|uniref:MFS transporter n=1 Tax=Flavihumibacter solisilvae TaxID=1349421 RepID=UPI000691BCE4|nr:MFS transporter [Flavihumibacter solisilvae]
MVQAIHFNGWFSRRLGFTRFLLMLILFSAVAQFASFGFIQAHVISFYGAQPEDISFAFQITYAGIITTLPIQFRLVRYFNTRSYLLTALLVGILLNLGCLYTHDLVLFSILRFFIGAITCLVAGCMLISIFSTLPESKRLLVGVSLFFSLILTCGVLVGVGASWVVLSTNWTVLYYGLVGLQVMALVGCMCVFKSKPSMKPYPLFQVDWYGSILMMFGSAATAFVLIYGPKRYWMADPAIGYATVFAVLMISLFLFRQAELKRPLIQLAAFKSGKFLFALFLLLLFWGIKDSINLVYGYAAGVLGWSSSDVVNAGLYNVAGVIIATVIAVKVILSGKQKLPLLLVAGFLVLCLYHVWVYLALTPDLSFADLCIPIFLQGFACGLLFVPVSVFCIATVPQSASITAIVVCTYARFLASLNSIAGYYTLQLNFNQHFKEGFLGKLVPENLIFFQRHELYKGLLVSKGFATGEATAISNQLIAKSSAVQSQLLTIRAIFFIGAVVAAILLVVLLLFAVVNKIKAARVKA